MVSFPDRNTTEGFIEIKLTNIKVYSLDVYNTTTWSVICLPHLRLRKLKVEEKENKKIRTRAVVRGLVRVECGLAGQVYDERCTDPVCGSSERGQGVGAGEGPRLSILVPTTILTSITMIQTKCIIILPHPVVEHCKWRLWSPW